MASAAVHQRRLAVVHVEKKLARLDMCLKHNYGMYMGDDILSTKKTPLFCFTNTMDSQFYANIYKAAFTCNLEYAVYKK